MAKSIEQRVRHRAGDACEYCQLPQSAYDLSFQIDHIIARQHGGPTRASNLAWACPRCNLNKGPNIAGIDPKSRQLVPLYHPRRDRWSEHFRWRGPRLIGLTPVGRATIRVLAVNHPDAVALRRMLRAEGIFPPESVGGVMRARERSANLPEEPCWHCRRVRSALCFSSHAAPSLGAIFLRIASVVR